LREVLLWLDSVDTWVGGYIEYTFFVNVSSEMNAELITSVAVFIALLKQVALNRNTFKELVKAELLLCYSIINV